MHCPGGHAKILSRMADATASSRAATRRLQASKLIRAVGQGVLIVVFSLYLIELGWKPVAVGVLFTASGLLTAAASWFVGIASDKAGRRQFLLAYEAATAVFAILLTVFDQQVLLVAACLFLGFGRTQSGRPGMMSAAEQAWPAQGATAAHRGMLFSTNAALAFLGMAAGSALTGLVPTMQTFLPGILAYRSFFLLAGVGAVVNLVLLFKATDTSRLGGAGRDVPEHEKDTDDSNPVDNRDRESAGNGEPSQTAHARKDGHAAGPGSVRRQENLFILKLALINSLNGIAVGLTSPLLIYWFKLRFGVGPGSIGPVFALTFLLTAASCLWTGKLTERFGIVRSVVVMRLAAVGMLILMPVVPSFTLAAIVHVVRSALGRGSIGARQALTMNMVRSSRRGFASSISNIAMMLPHSASPSIAGMLLEAGRLNLPFVLAAGLQCLFVTLYGLAFRGYDRVVHPKPLLH